MEIPRFGVQIDSTAFKFTNNLKRTAIVLSLVGLSSCVPAIPTINAEPTTPVSTLPSELNGINMPHSIEDAPQDVLKAVEGDVIPQGSFILVRYYGPDSNYSVLYYFITTTNELKYREPSLGTVDDIFWNFKDQGEALDFACFESQLDMGQGFNVQRQFDCQ